MEITCKLTHHAETLLLTYTQVMKKRIHIPFVRAPTAFDASTRCPLESVGWSMGFAHGEVGGYLAVNAARLTRLHSRGKLPLLD